MIELWFFLINLFYVVVAAAVVFGILRVRDALLDVSFYTWLSNLESNPIALSIWLSAWVLGVCFLVATALT